MVGVLLGLGRKKRGNQVRQPQQFLFQYRQFGGQFIAHDEAVPR